MKIPIPEVDERFDSIEDALERFIRICSVIVEKATAIYPEPFVNNIPAYALAFVQKVLLQASTLVLVARERKDYNTTCALVRMQADNMAILNLIYNESDVEEKLLRHFLYVMDGVSARHKELSATTMSYDGTIPRVTYDALYKQVQNTKDSDARCLAFCENEIKKRPIYAERTEDVKILVENRNWKYKSIKNPEKYKWKEMYEMLNIKRGLDMFSYQSQYVHGLSISNITHNDKDIFDAPLSFEVTLLGWLLTFLRKEYEPYIGSYTEDDLKKMAPTLFKDK